MMSPIPWSARISRSRSRGVGAAFGTVHGCASRRINPCGEWASHNMGSTWPVEGRATSIYSSHGWPAKGGSTLTRRSPRSQSNCDGKNMAPTPSRLGLDIPHQFLEFVLGEFHTRHIGRTTDRGRGGAEAYRNTEHPG